MQLMGSLEAMGAGRLCEPQDTLGISGQPPFRCHRLGS